MALPLAVVKRYNGLYTHSILIEIKDKMTLIIGLYWVRQSP